MKYTRKFPSENPFQSVEWETRTAEIKQGDTIVFRQENVEVPKEWSQLATNIVASKYFYGVLNTPERETSVRQLISRVADTIADWGLQDDYFDSKEDQDAFCDDLTYLLLHQYAAFNSPVWFNVGLYAKYGVVTDSCNWYWDKKTNRIKQPQNPYEYPQVSACFLQHVDDNMESIMDLARSDAMLFKFGSGSGTNLSTLRASCEGLSGGGHSSGPLSFMRIYDQVAETVTSGGRTRRAALLHCLNINHPDIEQFIICKAEEETHAKMLIDRGVSPERAARSVMYQNMNISVRVTDNFMEAVEQDEDWQTYWVTNPEIKGPKYKARDLWKKIAESAWACGDPAIQYDTTINNWNTIPVTGRINTSNPCSEYMAPDNSACNLASLNLLKFFNRNDGNYQSFEDAVQIIIIAQDILIDRASYPLKEIANNAHRCRQIGLGYTNLGALLMSLGLPYDSDKARDLCACITAIMTARAYLTSAELADALGPFAEWDKESMFKVIDQHADAAYSTVGPLALHATQLWDEVLEKGKNGFRNSQVTLCAPTGTISFLMDCDTTGIEPELALVKIKQLVGGGTLKLINQSIKDGLNNLGYGEQVIDIILDYLAENNTLANCPNLYAKDLQVFATSLGDNVIPWQAHLKMMAAAQPFLSGAISKTINLPTDATIEIVAEVYKLGWELGLKSVALYRDQSKSSQPLNIKTKVTSKIIPDSRIKLPDTRQSITHRFEINNHTGYFTVGLYPDGKPGELFIAMAKEGSTLGGLLDCFGIAISIGLQYGVPLDVFIEKFSHTRFEPSGWTPNQDIHMAKSIVDYIFRWLQKQFGSIVSNEIANDAPACDQCGAIMSRVGNCYLCPVCGTSGGCS